MNIVSDPHVIVSFGFYVTKLILSLNKDRINPVSLHLSDPSHLSTRFLIVKSIGIVHPDRDSGSEVAKTGPLLTCYPSQNRNPTPKGPITCLVKTNGEKPNLSPCTSGVLRVL